MIELPEIEFFRVPVNLDDETRKIYEEVLEHSKRRFEETLRTGEGAANVLSMLTRSELGSMRCSRSALTSTFSATTLPFTRTRPSIFSG